MRKRHLPLSIAHLLYKPQRHPRQTRTQFLTLLSIVHNRGRFSETCTKCEISTYSAKPQLTLYQTSLDPGFNYQQLRVHFQGLCCTQALGAWTDTEHDPVADYRAAVGSLRLLKCAHGHRHRTEHRFDRTEAPQRATHPSS